MALEKNIHPSSSEYCSGSGRQASQDEAMPQQFHCFQLTQSQN